MSAFTEFLEYLARKEALALQENAADMTPDEIVAADPIIPTFDNTRQYLDYQPGYICKTTSGNVVKLLQSYDSLIYTQQPENLPAQWGFYWSTQPERAKPFLKLSTSPYYKDSCCIFNGYIWRSTIDNNVFSPSEYPMGWEQVEQVEGDESE